MFVKRLGRRELIGSDSHLVTLDTVDLEAQVRDLEFVIAHSRRLPSVHPERLGPLGFNMGGMSCVVLAMRNPDVDAFVSLDAGILYHYPSELPGSSPHYDRSRLRCPQTHAMRSEAVATPGARGTLFETAVYRAIDNASHSVHARCHARPCPRMEATRTRGMPATIMPVPSMFSGWPQQ